MLDEDIAKKESGYSAFPALWTFLRRYYKHIDEYKNA